tara:strand:+ start:918 stop:1145 length:228 start_codon:yes stop_codon:yes gene_type:complete
MEKIKEGDRVLFQGLGYATINKMLKDGRVQITTEAYWDPGWNSPEGDCEFTVGTENIIKIYNRETKEWKQIREKS